MWHVVDDEVVLDNFTSSGLLALPSRLLYCTWTAAGTRTEEVNMASHGLLYVS